MASVRTLVVTAGGVDDDKDDEVSLDVFIKDVKDPVESSDPPFRL